MAQLIILAARALQLIPESWWINSENQVPLISYRLKLKKLTKSFFGRFSLLEKAALGMEICGNRGPRAARYLVEVQLPQLQRSLVGCSPQPLQQAPQLLRGQTLVGAEHS